MPPLVTPSDREGSPHWKRCGFCAPFGIRICEEILKKLPDVNKYLTYIKDFMNF
ncbi:hypothetical protein THEYE_A1212 [Thermodesulfovibrio yellowstonii DSM 11347]|uniref:Uncharacterized protein n=1 Tax=Thermodesulfovibrio yellowstonii (strain ATCC 51303 / DSM 11347 / YP87) TaxID=289376 RepID=B5YLB6_THEYD|nr:hypothetical protein THEYE_A1212 [Thermodesulfovibrio yellowstonii DSM 11347]